MKISAIICEYNPFHFGHAYHISEIKKNSDAVIADMSGSFTQRGIPAIVSKYERAHMALEGGVDLVLELPFPHCASSAQYFARAGIDIIENSGVVSEISFGSESGDIARLTAVAENMNSPAFPEICGAVSFYSFFASRYRSYPPYISRRQTISKPLARALLRLY